MGRLMYHAVFFFSLVATIWSVWVAPNSCIFDRGVIQRIFKDILALVAAWVSMKQELRLVSSSDILQGLFHSGRNTMNFTATLSRRINLKALVTQVPVYSGIKDLDGAGEGLSLIFRRWATKKTAGSTKNGRDSNPKYLGVKKFGGERVIPGNIIVRQRGTRFHPGNYVGMGKDHTLYALKEGCVKFERHKLSGRKWVHVLPKEGHELHPVYTSAVASKLKATA